MDDWADLSALEMAAAIRAGDLDIGEVTEASLAAAQADELGAFADIDEAYARDSARTAQRRLAAGEQAPLLGVPCPIKDLTQVAGLPHRSGSRTTEGNVATVDDGIVTRLAAAGTVLIGKTSTPEYGLPCYTEPDIGPPARTPWDPNRSAGGSSGGAASAVASGIVPFAHGSDGGGSIRIPASCCGLVGLKPTRGVVSPGPHSTDDSGLSTNGFLTRTVADTAAALDAVIGPWPGDQFPPAAGGFLAALDDPPPAGLHVGVLLRPLIGDSPVDDNAAEAARRAASLLAEFGHQVAEAPIPFEGAPPFETFIALWSVGALSIPIAAERERDLTPLTRYWRDLGRGVSGVQYAEAVTAMQQLQRVVAAAWEDFDVIVTPTLAQPPAVIGSLRDDADPAAEVAAQAAYTPWTSLYNMTGRPAINVPLHRAEVDGVVLPFGAMLGAAAGSDKLLLRLAAQLEQAAPWPRTPRDHGKPKSAG